MVELEVNAWVVRRAVDEVLDWKMEGGRLMVVVFMLLAVAVKRQTMVGRSMAILGYGRMYLIVAGRSSFRDVLTGCNLGDTTCLRR